MGEKRENEKILGKKAIFIIFASGSLTRFKCFLQRWKVHKHKILRVLQTENRT